MSYAKYMEDNSKIRQERQADYLHYFEETPRREEYIPYAVRYQIPQPDRVRKVRRNYSYCY